VGSSYPGYAYSDYGYAGYDDGGYVTAGVGWSDDGWRNRRFSRSSYDRGYRTVSRSSTRLNARASTGISERSGANVRVGTTGRSERMNMRASGNAEIRGGANMRTEGSAMRTAPNRSGTVRASTDVRSSGTVGMSRRSGSNGDSSR
jgi:hypothetical protein